MRRILILSLGCFVAIAAMAWAADAVPDPPGAQATGNAGTVEVDVTDPTGAVIPGAAVTIENRAARFSRSGQTDANGIARFTNLPPNPYHIEVNAPGFQPQAQDVTARTSVPVTVKAVLVLAQEKETVEVHSGASELVESVPTAHTDIDRELFSKLPRQTPAETGMPWRVFSPCSCNSGMDIS